jgi:hypothetical protein
MESDLVFLFCRRSQLNCSLPTFFRLVTDPFAALRRNVPMKTINAELVPWLIAKEGYIFADSYNSKVATEMIDHVIFRRN